MSITAGNALRADGEDDSPSAFVPDILLSGISIAGFEHIDEFCRKTIGNTFSLA